MTVGELMLALSRHDPDKPVVLNLGKNESANGCVATVVTGLNALRRPSGTFHDAWLYDDPAVYELGEGEALLDVVNITS